MKKRIMIIILLLTIIFVSGCGRKEDKQLICKIGDTTVTITLQLGQITKYEDQIKGSASNEEIKKLNDNYLKDITDDDEALKILREVLASNGGNCTQFD